jgi:pimeloyl-ACP methyl ester carboxylesterase
MAEEQISNAIVVAHSVSGVWLQLLLGAAPERISRMVFINAVVLKNGESFISNAVGPAQASAAAFFVHAHISRLSPLEDLL